MEQRPDSFFENVRQGFLTEAAAFPNQILVLDASRDKQIIHGEILARVEALIRRGNPS